MILLLAAMLAPDPAPAPAMLMVERSEVEELCLQYETMRLSEQADAIVAQQDRQRGADEALASADSIPPAGSYSACQKVDWDGSAVNGTPKAPGARQSRPDRDE